MNNFSERTVEDDERLLTQAAAESCLVYGGPEMARNPLEELLAAEAAAAGEGADAARVRVMGELLKRVLMFAVAGIEERMPEYRMRMRYLAEKKGQEIRMEKTGDSALGEWGTLERVVVATGQVLERWEVAKVCLRGKPGVRKDGYKAPGIVRVMVLEEVSKPGALPLQVGKRVLALAHLSAIPGVAHLSGSALARLCDETRQAVSLRERGLDEAMREATGGHRGARGLRHTVDPRKGKKKKEDV